MKSLKKQIIDYAVYLIVRTIICVIQALPIKVCEQIARFLAWMAVDVLGIRRKLIETNLQRVYPLIDDQTRRKITRAMWRHLALMIFEIAHAPRKIHETNWRKYFSVENRREIVSTLLLDRPKVLVSGHFGNFELGGFITGLLGFPGYTVARTLDNPFLDRYFRRFREAQGQFILNTAGSSTEIQQALEANHCLTLLGDQHTELGAIWVDFLGTEAACHKSLAVFTLSFDAPMLVVYCKRRRRFHDSKETEPMLFEVGSHGLIDPREMPAEINGVRDLTNWYNEQLSQIILAEPEQYWWVHNRWKPRPKRKQKTKTTVRDGSLAEAAKIPAARDNDRAA